MFGQGVLDPGLLPALTAFFFLTFCRIFQQSLWPFEAQVMMMTQMKRVGLCTHMASQNGQYCANEFSALWPDSTGLCSIWNSEGFQWQFARVFGISWYVKKLRHIVFSEDRLVSGNNDPLKWLVSSQGRSAGVGELTRCESYHRLFTLSCTVAFHIFSLPFLGVIFLIIATGLHLCMAAHERCRT